MLYPSLKCGLAVVAMNVCVYVNTFDDDFSCVTMYDTEGDYSESVREKPLGRKRGVVQVSERRVGCAGPVRGSAENNSRVTLARSASDPFLAGHELTRPNPICKILITF